MNGMIVLRNIRKELQRNIKKLEEGMKDYGMKVNVVKTKSYEKMKQ